MISRRAATLWLVAIVACHHSDGVQRVGDIVTLADSEWVVSDVSERGAHIASTTDATELKTTGTFVEIEFVVKNNSGHETSVMHPPNVIDDGGHHLAPIPHQAMYLKKGKAVGIDPLAAGSTNTFHSIVELPTGKKAVGVEVFSLSVADPTIAVVSLQ